MGITAGVNTGSNLLLEQITGMEQDAGVPMQAWVAMGFQDSGNAAGHYNGYNLRVYTENAYDYQKTKSVTNESIRESLANFKADPEYAASFLIRKVAGQWSNPDCGTLSRGLTKQENLSFVTNSMHDGILAPVLHCFMNWMQTWILFGLICYITIKKNKTNYEWMFFLIFLGGFLFHLFWEAGSRYAFPYYVMLLPYGCMGMVALEDRLEEWREKKDRNQKNKRWKVAGAVFLIVALVGQVSEIKILKSIGLISEGRVAMNVKEVENGYYWIKTGDGDQLYLTEWEGKILVMRNDNYLKECSLYCNTTGYVIRFQSSQNTLNLAGGEEVCSANIEAPFEWRIEKYQDNKFYILVNDDMALRYSTLDWTVKLAPFEEGEQELLWEITKEGVRR